MNASQVKPEIVFIGKKTQFQVFEEKKQQPNFFWEEVILEGFCVFFKVKKKRDDWMSHP